MFGSSEGQAIFSAVIGRLGAIEVRLWMPIVAALLTGLAFGWLFWGGRKDKIDDLTASERVRRKAAEAGIGEPAIDELFTGDARHGDALQDAPSGLALAGDVAERLQTIEGEIARARTDITVEGEVTAQFAEELDTLDAAVNRANGRLRLITDMVEKTSEPAS